jgi:hypothetical protein
VWLKSIPPRVHTIELVESEKIVPCGVAKQTWSVHVDGRFRPARLVTGAEVSLRQAERGCVWSRSIALRLAAGTRLELVQEVPRPRKRADTFSILTLDQKSKTLRRRTLHEITPDGRVAPLKR